MFNRRSVNAVSAIGNKRISVTSAIGTGAPIPGAEDLTLSFPGSFRPGAHEGPGESIQVSEDPNSFLHDGMCSLLQVIAVIGSLFSTWGLAIYTNAPPQTLCPAAHIPTMFVLEWLALGFFFLTVMTSLILIADLNGIPRASTAEHICRTWMIYIIPQVACVGGIGCLAAGFVIDVGARVGCWAFIFGAVAAPGFIVVISLIIIALGVLRGRLDGADAALNHHYKLTLWLFPFMIRARALTA